MGVSQRLLMHITSLINMAFNIIIMKDQNMQKSSIRACKLNEELEIVTKTIGLISRTPNHSGPPTKLSLKVMHLKMLPYSSERIHLKAPTPLTSCESSHLHQIKWG